MAIKKEENKKIKIFVIVGLLMVFCVVGYFRFFHKRSTATSEVKTGTPPVVSTPAVPAVGSPAQKAETDELSRQVWIRDVTRDIFEPGKSVRAADRARKDPAEPAPQPMRMVLNGIIYSKENPVAIINGQFQSVGDQIGGYRIVRIGPKGVLLKGEDKEIRLEVVDYGNK